MPGDGTMEDTDASKGREIVMKLTEYAFKVLQVDMSDFFDEHMAKFEQEDNDLTSGRGETLEQYDVYKLYTAELEKHMEEFALLEGFRDSQEAFETIEHCVAEDVEKNARAMETLTNQIQQIQLEWERRSQNSANQRVENSDGSESASLIAEAKSDADSFVRRVRRSAWEETTASSGDEKAPSKRAAEDISVSFDNGVDAKAESKSVQDESTAVDDSKEGANINNCRIRKPWPLGSVVEIRGIKAKPELNGLTAKVVDYDSISERHTIEIESSGESFKLKQENLTSTGEVCEATAKRAARQNHERATAAAQQTNRAPPIMLFCQPIPLESLIQSVLSIADYSTFSMIMRMKCKQAAMEKRIEAEILKLENGKATRALQLEDLTSGEFESTKSIELFASLRERIAALTPHRQDLNEETNTRMLDDNWEELLRGASNDKFQDLAQFVTLKRVKALCAPADARSVTAEYEELIEMSKNSPFVPDIAHQFLRNSHIWLDRIVNQIHASTRAVIQAQRQAAEEAKRRKRTKQIACNSDRKSDESMAK